MILIKKSKNRNFNMKIQDVTFNQIMITHLLNQNYLF